MFKSLIATIALACALVAPTTNVVYARGMTTTCEGKISWHPLRAYTAITKNYGTPEVSDECIFVTKSRVGRQILKTCPEDSMCSVEADIENASDQYEITRVISINRIGTPALDAVAAREKAAREQSRWIAIFLYSEKVKTCVANNLKGERTADSIGEVMKGVCSKESDALRAQLMKQFSYSGHYLFMNIRYELASDGYCARVVKTSDGFVALRKEPNAKIEVRARMRAHFPVHVGAPKWTKWVRV